MTANLPLFFAVTVVALCIVFTVSIWIGFYRVASQMEISRDKIFVLSAVVVTLFCLWLTLSIFLSARNYYHVDIKSWVPHLVIGMVVPVVIGYGLLLVSGTYREVIHRMPQYYVIGIQILRMIAGVLFLVMFVRHELPVIFAVTAGVGDFLVGATAPLVAYSWYRKRPYARRLTIVWNAFGLTDLIAAVFVGFISAPSAYQLIFTTPSTEILTFFPMVMIPVFLVPLAFLSHFFSLRLL